MALAIILNIFLLSIYGATSMEMHETVERMVMVRRTGSDLDPAATGFIYKRSSDEPAKVIKMKKDEVLEQLKKMPDNLYVQPSAFTAPLPVVRAAAYTNNEEPVSEVKPSETHVIPVVENAEEAKDEVDGLADEDDDFLTNEYADYKKHLDEYFRALDNGDEDKASYETKDDTDGNNDNQKGSDYHTEKYEAYSVSGKESYKKDYGDENSENDGSDFKSHGDEGEETDKYAKLYEKNEKNFDDYYDGKAFEGDFDKHGADDEYYGSDSGALYHGDNSGEGFQEGGFGDDGYHKTPSSVAAPHPEGKAYPGDFNADFGKGFHFEIKH